MLLLHFKERRENDPIHGISDATFSTIIEREANEMDFFDSIFDFNGDGMVDFGEQFVGFMMMNEILKDEPDDIDNPMYLSEEDD